MKNTKSTLGKLCAALLATVSCSMLFTACGTTDNETPAQHKHNYATTWTTDNNDHWHECTNSGCDQKEKDKAPHDWDDGQITTEATADADGVKTFTCTVCNKTKTEAVKYVAPLTENTDFAALVSDKVTEAEWKAAFAEASFSNCTIKLKEVCNDYVEDDDDYVYYNSSNTLYIDKTAQRDYRRITEFKEVDGVMVEQIPGVSSFWSIENNVITFYGYDYENEDFNTIYKNSVSLENISPDDGLMKAVEWMTTYKMICPDFGEFFNSFTYDDTLHAYVCNSTLRTNSIFESMERNYTDVIIKIVSGRLAYISLYFLYPEYDDTINDDVEVKYQYVTELYIYDYGTTQVTMPTNAIDYPEQDEEEGPPYEE